MSKDKDFYHRKNCRMCRKESLDLVIELTSTPPGNYVLEKTELLKNEICYPLNVYFCRKCGHLQLGHVVNPNILYKKNYTYVSGTSNVFLSHFKQLTDYIIKNYKITKGASILDIGSNDGSCLKYFKKINMKVLGVDPAENIAKIAIANGIDTIAQFFNFELSEKIRNKYGQFSFINSSNACAHIDDLDTVIKGIKTLLAPDGIFSIEVGYFADVLKNIYFDTIYHEHLDYHILGPFINLLKRFDLEVIDAMKIAPQGGSIRIIGQSIGSAYSISDNVARLIQEEIKLGLYDKKVYYLFNKSINNIKKKFSKMLSQINGKIIGYGAPTKSTTLMTHFNITNNNLDFIVEDNPLKIGKFTPLNHIEIKNAEEIYRYKPDYILILAWNFAESIIRKHDKFRQQGGKFIIPLPEPIIV